MSRRAITVLPGGRINVTAMLVVRTALLTLALSRSVVEVTSIQRMTARSEPQARLSIITTAPAPTDPPVNLTPPVAAGIVRIGNTLTTDDGVWDLPATFTYQWTRDGVPIMGATSSSYVPVAADIGPLIACEVTATGTGGPSLPAPSNDLASVWRDILVLRPGILIWDGTDPYCYGGVTTGNPVEFMYTVNGILLGQQAVTPNKATRVGNTLDFDDLDDYYDCPAPVVAYFHNDQSICVHVSGLSSSTGQMLYYALLSSPTWRSGRVAVSASPSRNDHRTNATQTIMVGPATFTQDIIVRYAAAPNMAIYNLTAGVTLHTTANGTRSTGSGGTLRIGADPGLTQTFGGAVRGLAFDNLAWDTATMAVYRACALAAGVM